MLLNEGGEATLLYAPYVWTFFGIFVALVVVGWIAKSMGWLYVEKVEEKSKKAKSSH
jgi:hypothetical protein